MDGLIQNIFPSLKILELAGNTERFQKWLKDYHKIDFDGELLQGYKFFIECAFSEFFNAVAMNNSFGIKEDILLLKACSEMIFIENLPVTCDKTILLKNIYAHYKPIQKAKTIESIKTAVGNFNERVSKIFISLYEKHTHITRHTSQTTAIKLLLMENLYIHFSQINNNGPVAYCGTLMKEFWIDKEKLNYCLKGYCYTLQYLWNQVLGDKTFNKTSLINLNKSDTWKDYIYNELSPDATDFEKMYGQTFDISKQTCLDSFFYRIKNEIISPIEKKYKFWSIGNPKELFNLEPVKFNKRILNPLFSKTNFEEPKLKIEEKLDMQLFWYQLEVFEPGKMFNGVPAFITLLAGTVALRKNEREFDKVYVCKFIHPLGVNQNDYSYGVLIDSKAAAGHFYSGWLLYYDCCGDYSGFSGSQQKKTEEIISQYVKRNLVVLREFTIEKEAFRKYILNHMYSYDVEKMTNERVQELEQKLLDDAKERKKTDDDIFGKAKALILELFTCFIYAKFYNRSHSVDWNINKKAGELDVCVYNDKVVIVVECKITPDNYNIEAVYKNTLKKVEKKFPTLEVLPIEFWFWNEPTDFKKYKNKSWLVNNNISYTVVSTNSTNNHLLNQIDLDNIRNIFKYKI